jgi:hypothetical protein
MVFADKLYPTVRGFGFSGKPFANHPSIDDVDNDGLLEMVMGSYDGRLFVWDLPGKYDEKALQWPTYMHDYQRTVNYNYKPKA